MDGATFDTLVYPVDTQNFGTPADIDRNGRSIIFFTRAVNELTPPNSGGGYVAGFFYARDLFPRRDAGRLGGCPGSNVAEIFYMLAPDPQGEVNGNEFSAELVRRTTVGTLAHEFEHLINASRRLYVNNANEFEDPWLDEALAHMAEELLFYRASGLAPRQNIGLEQITSSADPRANNAVNLYQIDNLIRYVLYLAEPDSNSLIGNDALPTRGASWAFLRYAADRKSGPDQPFLFKLVNSRTSGVDNLREVLGINPIDWMQDWTMAVYTDDAVPVDARYTQPSWNFRSLLPPLCQQARSLCRNRSFPLATHSLASAAERQQRLQAGGAAFLRFGIAQEGRVALLTQQGQNDPSESLRLSIVRTR